MGMISTLFKREIASFFATPVAYVFITIFLILSAVFAFFIGSLYEREQADLLPFFNFHPWLYLFLVPAIAMRTWSEERKSGSIELLMTLPISSLQAVVAKFLASWAVLGLSLLLTFPLWLTINYLGNPDNGVVVAAYIGSWLMAGAFLAIGMCMSALTKNQVVAFILAVVVCFLFVVSGSNIVLDAFKNWAPTMVIDTVASFSFLTHYESLAKGVIALNDVGYFFISIVIWLYASLLIIERKKAD
ncbi:MULTISPECIES: ABC transporter permease subunit [Alteromonadaceae]|uniref:ABC transporter permease subunit n=1 Tax=Alteromonadaceae TaxID=72275 RepID=UPI001C09C2BC|nr:MULTISPECIES: ABC transporter permease subunit [Aliiglaciecola]MBU2879677.1 ABC transporter permease subunit [Aliiglaciecola lipolytica]MDO6710044.1 ABC transporter permease subunit [Aliiglaciecola sp. 2_MG-2023]MDO6751192.1 ABC transporter permease subunit [Aliiglaciecola sp. 1_MG-2023]